jgi:hypothetical protein
VNNASEFGGMYERWSGVAVSVDVRLSGLTRTR